MEYKKIFVKREEGTWKVIFATSANVVLIIRYYFESFENALLFLNKLNIWKKI